MLNKDEQQISGVSNSTINQAKGNIINNYGISAKDVIDIVNSVVADKMSVFHKEAEETAKQRLTEFNVTTQHPMGMSNRLTVVLQQELH